jgi:hypothetical protein
MIGATITKQAGMPLDPSTLRKLRNLADVRVIAMKYGPQKSRMVAWTFARASAF